MSILLSFLAALRAGDLWAKALAIGLAFAAFMAFAMWQIVQIEQRGAREAIQKIERANQAARDAADEAERRAIDCAGRWDRGSQTCAR